MKLSSLPLKMSVSYRNRTYNRVLGGPRYIHLTKETNAVFSSFFSLLATVAISMNPITKWWISIITYFDIQINPYWNRTLTYHFSTSVGVNHDWTLGGPRYIHLTKETNAVFSSFFSLLATVAISMNPITKWWISIITYFDIQINPYWNRTLTYHFSTSVGVNHDWTLGGECSIQLSYDDTCRKPLILLGFLDFFLRPYIRLSTLLRVVNLQIFSIW